MRRRRRRRRRRRKTFRFHRFTFDDELS